MGDEARGKGLHCIGPCGPGKDFSPFFLTEMPEGCEQRVTGSLWFLRRVRKDCLKRYNNPGGLDHRDSGGDGEKC